MFQMTFTTANLIFFFLYITIFVKSGNSKIEIVVVFEHIFLFLHKMIKTINYLKRGYCKKGLTAVLIILK